VVSLSDSAETCFHVVYIQHVALKGLIKRLIFLRIFSKLRVYLNFNSPRNEKLLAMSLFTQVKHVQSELHEALSKSRNTDNKLESLDASNASLKTHNEELQLLLDSLTKKRDNGIDVEIQTMSLEVLSGSLGLGTVSEIKELVESEDNIEEIDFERESHSEKHIKPLSSGDKNCQPSEIQNSMSKRQEKKCPENNETLDDVVEHDSSCLKEIANYQIKTIEPTLIRPTLIRVVEDNDDGENYERIMNEC